MQSVDAANVELRYTTDGASVTTSSALFPTLGLTLSANTTLKVRAFHTLYYASEEVSSFYYVEIAARSAPVLPLALQSSAVREVPIGSLLQIGRSGEGQLFYVLTSSSLPDCSSATGWQQYTTAMPLATPATFTLCAYVKQIGYVRSAYSRAMFVVRPWAQTVSIQSSANVTSAISPHVGALTLTMSSEAGATIWFTLEPPRVNGTLCNAVAQAARIAPNLTLAANDNWQSYLDTHSVMSAPCTGEMATRCQTEPTDCWCAAISRTHTMSLTFCLSSQVRVHG